MKNYIFILLSVCLLFSFTSCKDNSAGPDTQNTEETEDTDETETETQKTNITGSVQAPDGSTPISGATVYVGAELPENSTNKSGGGFLSKDGDCKEPSVDYQAYTCTSADGSFEFEVELSADKTEVELKIFKGSFTMTQSVSIGSGGSAEADTINVSSDAVKMAVVTGSYDRMQDILAKVGFGEIVTDQSSARYGKLKKGTEKFDLYDGDFSLDDSKYPEMKALFEDGDGDGEPDINNYDIVFINCGASESQINSKSKRSTRHRHFGKTHSSDMSMADISTIQNYVKNGGTLYATDWAYDYTEQAFPSYIDFLGSSGTAADKAEGRDYAQQGNSGLQVDADIMDSSLQNWLTNVSCKSSSCLNSDQTVHVEDFLLNWAVIDTLHSGSNAKTWIKGPVEWGSESGVQPLTVSYTVQDGQVVYSSYHTIESEFSPEFRPQERILQYLVFE